MYSMRPEVVCAVGAVFGLALLLSFVFAFRETIRELKALFDLRRARAALRRMGQFRLRTVLILFVGFHLALVMWIYRDALGGGAVWSSFLGAALLFLFFWACLEDLLWPTTSKRWKSILRRGGPLDGPKDGDCRD
jgi:hypothetical protein